MFGSLLGQEFGSNLAGQFDLEGSFMKFQWDSHHTYNYLKTRGSASKMARSNDRQLVPAVGWRPLVLSTWTSPRAAWVSPEVEQVTHKSIYDPTSKATHHHLHWVLLITQTSLESICGTPHVGEIIGSILEAGMITLDFPAWATEHSIVPKNPECLGECTYWQMVHAMFLSKWYFLSTLPSFLLSPGNCPSNTWLPWKPFWIYISLTP